MKNGEIILCKGIKLDKGYENVLSYSENSMVTLCRNNKIAESTKYHILDPIRGEMDVSIPYSSCIYANYIAFRNPNVGNKWYFAFVNNVEYINPATTKIYYKVDVFSTWYSKMNIGEGMIEREHVDDDAIGKHTVPENLETGEFVINAAAEVFGVDDFYLCNIYVGVSKVANGLPGSIYGSDYAGIYSGSTYYMFDLVSDVGTFIRAYDKIGLGDSITSVFILPKKLYNPAATEKQTWNISYSTATTYTVSGYIVTQSNLPSSIGTSTIYINTDLNGYTPKNNKLFTGEFNYLYVTNNAGTDVKYNYEDFIDHTPSFVCNGVITIGGSIRMYPQKYKLFDCSPRTGTVYQGNEEYNYGISCGKYPTCSWTNDAYTNWLTQNATNMQIANDRVFVSSMVNTYEQGTGGGQLITNTIDQAINNYANKVYHSYLPNQAKGSMNSGDITLASASIGYYFQKMSVRYEMAKKIDDFFSRFGYRVNDIKTPNILSRTQFNYVKVGGNDEIVHGDIPAADLEEINNIFRKGVTIFHDYSTFGNYTQTNSIVTP